MSSPTGRLFARLGQLSPLHLGAGYVGVMLAGVLLRAAMPALAPVAALVGIVALLVLFVVVTWYRDDDALAAGVLLAIVTGLAILAAQVLTEILASGGVGGVLLMVPTFAFAIVVRAIVVGVIGAGVVWLARRITALLTRRRRAS